LARDTGEGFVGEAAMAIAKKRSSVSAIQFVALIVATIALSLVVDFGRKVALYRHLQLEEARLDQGIEYEENRRDYLEWLREYIQTDSFVESWARREWKMVKPGETSVVPVMTEAPVVPQIRPQEESQPSEGSRWQEWWKFFFDALPGL
jgi:cell division protein FtsB